jgi:dihydrofolate reductase
MRKVIMWDMLSVDGFIEDQNGSLDWFRFDDELETYINETNATAKALLFGRRTYQMMAAYWPSAEGKIAEMNGIEKVVFSRTLDNVEWNNSRLVKENVPEEVAKVKGRAGGDIFVFGSADLAATLLEHGLVDEIRLGINPVMLGGGTPLFKGQAERLDLKLLATKVLKSGLVILHYEPQRR